MLLKHWWQCEPIQMNIHRIREDRTYMNEVMHQGAEKASARAAQTLKQVYQAIGFVTRP